MDSKIIFYVILLIIVTSCRKESSYSTTNYMCNTSSTFIKLTFYKNGVKQNYLMIDSIKANECKTVLHANGFGKSDGPNYVNNIISKDSVIIEFNNTVQAIHYGYFITTVPNPKAILFNNTRNILNGVNWKYKIISETKYFKETELKFTFEEQDYLDANQ